MMPKEYRNKLIVTGLLLLGIIIFTVVDGFIRYAPEENPDTQGTEWVSDTELNNDTEIDE